MRRCVHGEKWIFEFEFEFKLQVRHYWSFDLFYLSIDMYTYALLVLCAICWFFFFPFMSVDTYTMHALHPGRHQQSRARFSRL